MNDHKVVFLHGFSQEETTRIIRGVRSVTEDPGSVAFCMSTKNNLDWKVKDLIADVVEEHEYMKNNPPPPKKDAGE
jgi:hypothetical protein